MRDRASVGWWIGLLVGWPIWLIGGAAVTNGVTGMVVRAVPFAVPAVANRVLDLVVIVLLAYVGARVLRALKAPDGVFLPLVVATIVPLIVIAVYAVSTGSQLDLFVVVYGLMYVAAASLGAWLGISFPARRAAAVA